jgi:two-component system response regulator FixJ
LTGAKAHGARIHIVEDDAMVRDALTACAESAGHQVTAHHDAESFLATLDTEDAGCVVIDVGLPGMDGLQLIGELSRIAAELPILAISGGNDVSAAVRALKGGALDFIQKPFTPDRFVSDLAEALRRGAAMAEAGAARRDIQMRARRLSDRELEVMKLIVGGVSNGEAAAALGLSVRTVENHRARLMTKMRAANLSELVRLTLRLEQAVGREAAGAWPRERAPPTGRYN